MTGNTDIMDISAPMTVNNFNIMYIIIVMTINTIMLNYTGFGNNKIPLKCCGVQQEMKTTTKRKKNECLL